VTISLEALDLRKTFGDRLVVDDVSVTVPPARITGILGPNGAGKTTVFKMILGLVPEDRGEVRFGERLNGLPMYRRCRLGIGYLPQGPSVFRGLSVEDNLAAVLMERRAANPKERIDGLLTRFGLASLRVKKASTLSGGERRKLEFARALCADPKVLLCDEPFAGVDPIAAKEIASAMKDLAAHGIGLFITDHNVRDALSVCDTVHILAEGRIVASGSPEEIVRSDIAKRLYLGESFSVL
jgi:lipopolysaccharide export system ATP-binding protein